MNTDEATTVCEAMEFFKGIDTLLFFQNAGWRVFETSLTPKVIPGNPP